MDAFLSIFYSFMVQSADDVYQDRKEFNSDSDAYKTGVEIYFINNMIQHLGDFVLQEKSPYSKEGQQRVSMSTSYGAPNFSSPLKTIITMR